MKNFVSQGNTLAITAAAAIASGDGVLTGSLFGVAAGDIAVGEEGIVNLTGVYDLPKAASQAWTVGAKVYWDNANKRCTTAASGNTLIGAAVLAVGGTASEVVGRVRLNGVA
jgi:predicted RecA/RadA family phage recombinase